MKFPNVYSNVKASEMTIFPMGSLVICHQHNK